MLASCSRSCRGSCPSELLQGLLLPSSLARIGDGPVDQELPPQLRQERPVALLPGRVLPRPADDRHLDPVDVRIVGRLGQQGHVLADAQVVRRQPHVQFDETLISSLVKKKIEAEIEMTYDVKLLEGAMNLLESLCDKVKLGLASMNNRRVIDHLLDAMDVRKFFGAVLTAEDIIRSKPDPEIFLKCARKLNSKPSKCVVIEDSIYGVKAAKNAGMRCVVVLTGVYRREELDLEKPDLIVNSLKQSREILDFILE